MLIYSLRLIILISLLGFLFACQTTQKSSVEPVVEVKDLNLNLTTVTEQNHQIKQALSLLEKGDYSKATHLIDEVLSINPTHKLANNLKQQLSQEATSLFNTTRFTDYKIKRGDTLGGIAQEWLGDSLYFVSLAKLNQIKSPSLLESGITIKIPLIASSKIISQENKNSEKNLKLLNEDYFNKNYLSALKKINILFVLDKHQDQLDEIQVKLLSGYADSSITTSDKQQMIAQCELLLVSSKNNIQKKILQDFIDQQSVILLNEEATTLFENSQYIESVEKFIHAKEIYKESKLVNLNLENQLVDKLHEQAIVNYRNQNLNDALKLWSLIYQLQPDNKLAIKYIQRTKNLLNKLNQY